MIQVQLVKSLEQGNQLLKDLNREVSLEAVEKLMDDTTDAVAYQKVVFPLVFVWPLEEILLSFGLGSRGGYGKRIVSRRGGRYPA